MFAGGWTGPGHYVCSIAAGDGPDADIVLVTAETGEQRTLARGGFLSVNSVSADERFLLARRGPRGYRHIVVIDIATGVQRRRAAAGRAGRDRLGGRPVRPRRPLGLPARLAAGRARARTAPGSWSVPLSEDGVPGPGRVVLYRPDADLDGYALRADGTALAVWTVREVTELWVHDLSDGSPLRQVALPEPVMPGWSLAADGATLLAELTGPLAPRGLWVVPLDADAGPPVPLPSAPRRPDPARAR